MIFFVFLTLVDAWPRLYGCNDIGENGNSKCSEIYAESNLLGLQCCMTFRVEDRNFFQVPIVVLPSQGPMDIHCRPRKGIFNGESTSNCKPQIKCAARNYYQIQGFFNFLDLYSKIPFDDYPSKLKSLNWDCFNTIDKFEIGPFPESRNEKLKSKRSQLLKSRLHQNFCRTILYVHYIYNFKGFDDDVCNHSVAPFPRLYPTQMRGRRKLKSSMSLEINVLQTQSPAKSYYTLPAPISFVNQKNETDRTSNVSLYAASREKNFISVFADYAESWHDMNVNSSSIIETHCGCFS